MSQLHWVLSFFRASTWDEKILKFHFFSARQRGPTGELMPFLRFLPSTFQFNITLLLAQKLHELDWRPRSRRWFRFSLLSCSRAWRWWRASISQLFNGLNEKIFVILWRRLCRDKWLGGRGRGENAIKRSWWRSSVEEFFQGERAFKAHFHFSTFSDVEIIDCRLRERDGISSFKFRVSPSIYQLVHRVVYGVLEMWNLFKTR